MDSTQKTYRIGIDIGGTFTDIVLMGDDGSVLTQKCHPHQTITRRAFLVGWN